MVFACLVNAKFSGALDPWMNNRGYDVVSPDPRSDHRRCLLVEAETDENWAFSTIFLFLVSFILLPFQTLNGSFRHSYRVGCQRALYHI